MQLDQSLDCETFHLGPVILVVDDDPDVCTLIAAVLAGQASVITACDGYEAVQKAAACHPALVVCDTEMPGLRGPEVMDALAADPALADIPVILTSGYPRSDVLGGAQPAAFLQKPFTLDELTSAVNQVLSTSVLSRQI